MHALLKKCDCLTVTVQFKLYLTNVIVLNMQMQLSDACAVWLD